MTDTFNGFPRDAFTFFAGLARNNNRDWFQAHREVYEQACREPMKQLIAALGSDPARTKITRINRDMRFARGQAPYRTHIATGVGDRYLSLSAEGLYIGAGMYKPEGPTLERFRNAIAAAPGVARRRLPIDRAALAVANTAEPNIFEISSLSGVERCRAI